MKMNRPASIGALLAVAFASLGPASVGTGAQECPRGLQIQRASLIGLTTATPGSEGRVSELRWPTTVWRNEMWLHAVVTNEGPSVPEEVLILAEARVIAGPLAVKADAVSLDPRGASRTLPATWISHSTMIGIPPGDSEEVTIRVRLNEIIPWFTDSLQTKVRPNSVEFRLAAFIRGSPDTSCVDDIRDNQAVFRLPLTYPY